MARGIVRASDQGAIWREAAGDAGSEKIPESTWADFSTADQPSTSTPPSGVSPPEEIEPIEFGNEAGPPEVAEVVIPKTNKFKYPANSLKNVLQGVAPGDQADYPEHSSPVLKDWFDSHQAFHPYVTPKYQDALKAVLGEDDYAKLLHHMPKEHHEALTKGTQKAAPKSNKYTLPTNALKKLLDNPNTTPEHVQQWVDSHQGYAKSYLHNPHFQQAIKKSLGTQNYEDWEEHLQPGKAAPKAAPAKSKPLVDENGQLLENFVQPAPKSKGDALKENLDKTLTKPGGPFKQMSEDEFFGPGGPADPSLGPAYPGQPTEFGQKPPPGLGDKLKALNPDLLNTTVTYWNKMPGSMAKDLVEKTLAKGQGIGPITHEQFQQAYDEHFGKPEQAKEPGLGDKYKAQNPTVKQEMVDLLNNYDPVQAQNFISTLAYPAQLQKVYDEHYGKEPTDEDEIGAIKEQMPVQGKPLTDPSYELASDIYKINPKFQLDKLQKMSPEDAQELVQSQAANWPAGTETGDQWQALLKKHFPGPEAAPTPAGGDEAAKHKLLAEGIKSIFPNTPLDLDNLSVPELKQHLENFKTHLEGTPGLEKHVEQVQALYDQHFGPGAAQAAPSPEQPPVPLEQPTKSWGQQAAEALGGGDGDYLDAKSPEEKKVFLDYWAKTEGLKHYNDPALLKLYDHPDMQQPAPSPQEQFQEIYAPQGEGKATLGEGPHPNEDKGFNDWLQKNFPAFTGKDDDWYAQHPTGLYNLQQKYLKETSGKPDLAQLDAELANLGYNVKANTPEYAQAKLQEMVQKLKDTGHPADAQQAQVLQDMHDKYFPSAAPKGDPTSPNQVYQSLMNTFPGMVNTQALNLANLPPDKLQKHFQDMAKATSDNDVASGKWQALHDQYFGGQQAKSPGLQKYLDEASSPQWFGEEYEGEKQYADELAILKTPQFHQWFEQNYPNGLGPDDYVDTVMSDYVQQKQPDPGQFDPVTWAKEMMVIDHPKAGPNSKLWQSGNSGGVKFTTMSPEQAKQTMLNWAAPGAYGTQKQKDAYKALHDKYFPEESDQADIDAISQQMGGDPWAINTPEGHGQGLQKMEQTLTGMGFTPGQNLDGFLASLDTDELQHLLEIDPAESYNAYVYWQQNAGFPVEEPQGQLADWEQELLSQQEQPAKAKFWPDTFNPEYHEIFPTSKFSAGNELAGKSQLEKLISGEKGNVSKNPKLLAKAQALYDKYWGEGKPQGVPVINGKTLGQAIHEMVPVWKKADWFDSQTPEQQQALLKGWVTDTGTGPGYQKLLDQYFGGATPGGGGQNHPDLPAGTSGDPATMKADFEKIVPGHKWHFNTPEGINDFKAVVGDVLKPDFNMDEDNIITTPYQVDLVKQFWDKHFGTPAGGGPAAFDPVQAAAEYGNAIGAGPDVHGGGKPYKEMSYDEFKAGIAHKLKSEKEDYPYGEALPKIQAIWDKYFGGGAGGGSVSYDPSAALAEYQEIYPSTTQYAKFKNAEEAKAHLEKMLAKDWSSIPNGSVKQPKLQALYDKYFGGGGEPQFSTGAFTDYVKAQTGKQPHDLAPAVLAQMQKQYSLDKSKVQEGGPPTVAPDPGVPPVTWLADQLPDTSFGGVASGDLTQQQMNDWAAENPDSWVMDKWSQEPDAGKYLNQAEGGAAPVVPGAKPSDEFFDALVGNEHGFDQALANYYKSLDPQEWKEKLEAYTANPPTPTSAWADVMEALQAQQPTLKPGPAQPAFTQPIDVDALNKDLEDIYDQGIAKFDEDQSPEDIKATLEGGDWLGDTGDTPEKLKQLQAVYDKYFPGEGGELPSPADGQIFSELQAIPGAATDQWDHPQYFDDPKWAKDSLESMLKFPDEYGISSEAKPKIQDLLDKYFGGEEVEAIPFDMDAFLQDMKEGDPDYWSPGGFGYDEYSEAAPEDIKEKLESLIENGMLSGDKEKQVYQDAYDKWFGQGAAPAAAPAGPLYDFSKVPDTDQLTEAGLLDSQAKTISELDPTDFKKSYEWAKNHPGQNDVWDKVRKWVEGQGGSGNLKGPASGVEIPGDAPHEWTTNDGHFTQQAVNYLKDTWDYDSQDLESLAKNWSADDWQILQQGMSGQPDWETYKQQNPISGIPATPVGGEAGYTGPPLAWVKEHYPDSNIAKGSEEDVQAWWKKVTESLSPPAAVDEWLNDTHGDKAAYTGPGAGQGGITGTDIYKAYGINKPGGTDWYVADDALSAMNPAQQKEYLKQLISQEKNPQFQEALKQLYAKAFVPEFKPPPWDWSEFGPAFKDIYQKSEWATGSDPGQASAQAKLKGFVETALKDFPTSDKTKQAKDLYEKWFGPITAQQLPDIPYGGQTYAPPPGGLSTDQISKINNSSYFPSPAWQNYTPDEQKNLLKDLIWQHQQNGHDTTVLENVYSHAFGDLGDISAIKEFQEPEEDEGISPPAHAEEPAEEDLAVWTANKPADPGQYKNFAAWWAKTKLTPEHEQAIYQSWFPGKQVSPEFASSWMQQIYDHHSKPSTGDLMAEGEPTWAGATWALGGKAPKEWPVFKLWATKEPGLPNNLSIKQKLQIWNGLTLAERAEIAGNYLPANPVDTDAVVGALSAAFPDSDFSKWAEMPQGTLRKNVETLAKGGYDEAIPVFNQFFGGKIPLPEPKPEAEAEKAVPKKAFELPVVPISALPTWVTNHWGNDEATAKKYTVFSHFAKAIGADPATIYPGHAVNVWDQMPQYLKDQVAQSPTLPFTDEEGYKAWKDSQPRLIDHLQQLLPELNWEQTGWKSPKWYFDKPNMSGYEKDMGIQLGKMIEAQPDPQKKQAMLGLYHQYFGGGKTTLAQALSSVYPEGPGGKLGKDWDTFLQATPTDAVKKELLKRLKKEPDPEKWVALLDTWAKYFPHPDNDSKVSPPGIAQVTNYLSNTHPFYGISSGKLKALKYWKENGSVGKVPYAGNYQLNDYDPGPYVTTKANTKDPGEYPGYHGWTPPGLAVGEGFKTDPAMLGITPKKTYVIPPEAGKSNNLKELLDNSKKWEPEAWNGQLFLEEYKKALPEAVAFHKEHPEQKGGIIAAGSADRDTAKNEIGAMLRDYGDSMSFWQKQRLENLWDKYFTGTGLGQSDKDVLQSDGFRQWFDNAPVNYQRVVKLHPGKAIDDYHEFMQGGAVYQQVPEGSGKSVRYDLTGYHNLPYTVKGDPNHVYFNPNYKIPFDPKGAIDSQHPTPNVWPGFTKNPMRPGERQKALRWEELPPASVGQQELMLGPGESFVPEKKPVELHRGVSFSPTRYSGPVTDPYEHLKSDPDAYAAKQNTPQAKEYLKELHRKWLMDNIRSRWFGAKAGAESVPDLFNTAPGTDMADVPPDWATHAPQGAAGVLDFNKWAKDNDVPGEQLWELAKKWGVNDPDKYGPAPLSEGPWGTGVKENFEHAMQTDPGFANLLLDYLEATDYRGGEGYAPPGSIGDHWTITKHTAESFGGSGTSPGDIIVHVTGDWVGQGEWPDDPFAVVSWSAEHEISLTPGAPVFVKRLRLTVRGDDNWKDLDIAINPHIRHASRIDPLATEARIERLAAIPEIEARIERLADGLDDPKYSERPWLPGEDSWKKYYSPHEMNPESSDPARPIIDWKTQNPEQSPLPYPGGSPRERAPQPLYRGLMLDLRHPELAEIRRALLGPELERGIAGSDQYGLEPSQHELFPGTEMSDKVLGQASPEGYDNRELGEKILDYLGSGHYKWNPDYGVGTHWSTDPTEAKSFAGYVPPSEPWHLPVLMRADWKGVGEDPYRSESAGSFPEESEITMLPTANMDVQSLMIKHPKTQKFHEVLDAPSRRTATSLTEIEARIESLESQWV